jgi:RNAse (barnase) inhibitor barstar
MRTLEIHGQEFDSIEGFYKSLEPCLMEGQCPWGQNLDSLDEIVSCNFNYSDNKENDVNLIIWTDFQKSKNEIYKKRGDKTVIEIIEEIFNSNKTIEFITK